MIDRTHPTSRRVIEGSIMGAGALLALVLVVMVNYLAARHYQRFDWTSGKLYSLSDKSLAVVGDLDRAIEIILFLVPDTEVFTAADELASRYVAANPQRIRKRTIDPARNLLAAQQLMEEHGLGRGNVIVVASEDDRRVIEEFDLVAYDYSGAQYGQPPSLKEFKGEQQITSAILALVEARKPRVLVTTGHGEAPLDEPGNPRALREARDLLGQDNFEIEEWSSLGQSEVPPETDLVVIAGPTTNFLPPELELFSRYLEAGGRMLVLLDPAFLGGRMVDLGLADWLAGYGIGIGRDVVVDPAGELPLFGPATIYTDSWGYHPIVEDLEQTRTRVLLPLARSVRKLDDVPEGLEVTELLRTSDEGWGETNLEALDDVQRDDDDLAGPVALGVVASFKVEAEAEVPAAEEPTPADDVPPAEEQPATEPSEDEDEEEPAGPEGRLVIFGDADFATDSQIANAANAALLLNTLNWLVKREQLISIAGRRPEETRLNLTTSELLSIYLLVLVVMPGLSIALGVSVHLRRRR